MSELHPLTRAEATGYKETSRHADVLAFLSELAGKTDHLQVSSMGKSGEGQDIPVAVLSDRGAFTPGEARAQKKVVVMIQANIHAGEVEGKESLLALARDLTLTRLGERILSKACLVFVPDLNPDGNDRISPENRKLDLANLEGQVNPEGGVGTRNSGEGWNLNRDYMKQEAPEIRHLAALFQAWWPDVFVDCHTSDGSITALDLTYDTSHSNQHLFEGTLSAAREMLDSIARKIEERHGYRAFWYGNYAEADDPDTGWQTYPALPRFGSHYRGLQGRLDVLLETYSYLSFERRCQVIYAWLLELVRYSAKHRKALRRVARREDERTIARGASPDPWTQVGINYGVARRDDKGALVFDYPAHARDDDPADLPAFEREALTEHRYPGETLTVYRKIPHKRWFSPIRAVTTPSAYLAPAHLAPALRGHGISFEELSEPAELEVESYIVLARENTFSPDVACAVVPLGASEIPLSQNPTPVRFETVLEVRPERRTATFPTGTLRVPTAQRAGTLAVYLLEPCSDDGLARWQLLDPHLEIGKPFPIHRVPPTRAITKRKAE